jgi:predicted transposase YbfD/YdcC
LSGRKEGEVNAVRSLLKALSLDSAQITLDALHFNPVTTAQIAQAGGKYLIQLKGNQPRLQEQCRQHIEKETPVSSDRYHEKAHGRLTQRSFQLFSLQTLDCEERWKNSEIRSLIVVDRETKYLKTGRASYERSYYLSNQNLNESLKSNPRPLTLAIQNHWAVETHNHIRDVTFKEDSIRTSHSNQAQVMSAFRTLAISFFNCLEIKNFKEAAQIAADSSLSFFKWIKQLRFL